jgi:hypothetical protein
MTPTATGWIDVPVTKLLLAEWNYKSGDEELAGKLRVGMERNGQIETLLIREVDGDLYEVINGNHRLPVMLELGIETAHCYCVGRIATEAAVRLAVELNETRFAVDPLILATRLDELETAFGRADLLETLPFADFQFDAYAGMLKDVEWHDPVEKEQPTGDDGTMTCPTCDGKGRVPREDNE